MKRTLRLLPGAVAATALLAAATVVPQQPAVAAQGWCTSSPRYDDEKYGDPDQGKWRMIHLKCSGVDGVDGYIYPASATVWVQADHDVYVEVCDNLPDDVGPRLELVFTNGTTAAYGDYGGSGEGCRTHRIGFSDTPEKWKLAANHDKYVSKWRLKWGTESTPYFVWPLHSF